MKLEELKLNNINIVYLYDPLKDKNNVYDCYNYHGEEIKTKLLEDFGEKEVSRYSSREGSLYIYLKR